MKSHAIKKSSFTLPASEIPLINQLKKKLGLKSSTDVVRYALKEVQKVFDRNKLREELRLASQMVREVNRDDYKEWDDLLDGSDL
jgi:hypothetical protein